MGQYLPQAKIILFGSRARGTDCSESDIDIALDNKKPIALQIIAKIDKAIEGTSIPVFIDLVDFQEASEDLKVRF